MSGTYLQASEVKRKDAYRPCCGACPVGPSLAMLDRVPALAPGTAQLHSHASMLTQHSPVMHRHTLTSDGSHIMQHIAAPLIEEGAEARSSSRLTYSGVVSSRRVSESSEEMQLSHARH